MSFVCLAGCCRHYDAKGNAIMGLGAERVEPPPCDRINTNTSAAAGRIHKCGLGLDEYS